MELFNSMPLTSVSIMIISTSLVLFVLLGGLGMLLRGRRTARPRPRRTAAKAPDAGVRAAPSPPPEARTALDAEYELARRIGQLERAISALSERLESAGAEADGQGDAVTVLSKAGARREELIPRILDLRRQGLAADAIARRLEISEEQLGLLIKVAAAIDAAVGA